MSKNQSSVCMYGRTGQKESFLQQRHCVLQSSNNKPRICILSFCLEQRIEAIDFHFSISEVFFSFLNSSEIFSAQSLHSDATICLVFCVTDFSFTAVIRNTRPTTTFFHFRKYNFRGRQSNVSMTNSTAASRTGYRHGNI